MCNDVEDLAMEWVLVMKASEHAESRRAELEAWLQRNRSHRVAYEEASGLWDCLNNVAVVLRQEGRPLTPEELLSEIADVARRRVVKLPH